MQILCKFIIIIQKFEKRRKKLFKEYKYMRVRVLYILWIDSLSYVSVFSVLIALVIKKSNHGLCVIVLEKLLVSAGSRISNTAYTCTKSVENLRPKDSGS